jgi:hypothetical protein
MKKSLRHSVMQFSCDPLSFFFNNFLALFARCNVSQNKQGHGQLVLFGFFCVGKADIQSHLLP